MPGAEPQLLAACLLTFNFRFEIRHGGLHQGTACDAPDISVRLLSQTPGHLTRYSSVRRSRLFGPNDLRGIFSVAHIIVPDRPSFYAPVPARPAIRTDHDARRRRLQGGRADRARTAPRSWWAA